MVYVCFQVVAECISEIDVNQTDHLPLLQQLVRCVCAIISSSLDKSKMLSACLFTILLKIAATKHGQSLEKQVKQKLNDVS